MMCAQDAADFYMRYRRNRKRASGKNRQRRRRNECTTSARICLSLYASFLIPALRPLSFCLFILF